MPYLFRWPCRWNLPQLPTGQPGELGGGGQPGVCLKIIFVIKGEKEEAVLPLVRITCVRIRTSSFLSCRPSLSEDKQGLRPTQTLKASQLFPGILPSGSPVSSVIPPSSSHPSSFILGVLTICPEGLLYGEDAYFL